MELLASSGYVDWASLWKIVVIGLLAGSGLVGVYSIGLVALSWTEVGGKNKAAATTRGAIGWVLAVLCFLIVVGGVAYGIDSMLAK